MSTSKRIAARDVIRVEYLGKRRTAVVLVTDEDTDAISVIFGTRTHREELCVWIAHPSPSASMLRLSEPTFFYVSTILQMRRDLANETIGRCPPGLFLELRKLHDTKYQSLTRPQPGDAAAAELIAR